MFILAFSCTRELPKREYFIFSVRDSIYKSIQDSIYKCIDDSNRANRLPPPPPPPPGLRWYSNVVMIFDTANKIYLYQTIHLEKKYKWIKSHPNYISETKFPNFIGLTPDQLLTLDSKYFIDFLKDNDDIFKLDTNYNESMRLFFIASRFDTIKNEAFYDLLQYVKKDKRKLGRIAYVIRNTTEEENNVLYFKRTNKTYNPSEVEWTKNFITGDFYPLTKEYDSIENISLEVAKSIMTFKPKCFNTRTVE